MDVFYRNTNGQLTNAWWDITSGWHTQTLASGMVGDPTAVARSPSAMNVFYRDGFGEVINVSWSPGAGWHTTIIGSGMAGDVAAVSETSTHIDVFYRNVNSNLANLWWDATSGWHRQVIAAGVVGHPAAVSTDPTHVDVFYRSTLGHLVTCGSWPEPVGVRTSSNVESPAIPWPLRGRRLRSTSSTRTWTERSPTNGGVSAWAGVTSRSVRASQGIPPR